jgi:hypothetical protein
MSAQSKECEDKRPDPCGSGAVDLIALAAAVAVKISECTDTGEINTILEFLGLLRHDLEVIKWRTIFRA